VRRLLRILFNAVTALSLVLAVLVAALWVRSYWIGNYYNRTTTWNTPVRGHQNWTFAASNWGNLLYCRSVLWTDDPEFIPVYASNTFLQQFDVPASRERLATDLAQDGLNTFAGFGWTYDRFVTVGNTRQSGFAWKLAVPYWFPVATLMVPALLWRLRFYRERQRLGLCRSCGYDLRATPERCPECGSPVAT
jgi:hypothetical protein